MTFSLKLYKLESLESAFSQLRMNCEEYDLKEHYYSNKLDTIIHRSLANTNGFCIEGIVYKEMIEGEL